jgi:hypothetical protein
MYVNVYVCVCSAMQTMFIIIYYVLLCFFVVLQGAMVDVRCSSLGKVRQCPESR